MLKLKFQMAQFTIKSTVSQLSLAMHMLIYHQVLILSELFEPLSLDIKAELFSIDPLVRQCLKCKTV